MLTRFKGRPEFDLYRCVEFFKQYSDFLQMEKSLGKPPDKIQNLLPKKISQIKDSLDFSDFIEAFGDISLETVVQIEKALNYKIIIWTKRDRRSCLRKSWENNSDEDRPPGTKTINLFSSSFDQYTNRSLDNLALVLDIKLFTQKHKWNPDHVPPAFQKMDLFQALVMELHPTLIGHDFDRKVDCYRSQWGKSTFQITDAKQFHNLFGVGIQLWGSQSVKKQKVTKMLFNTYWKRKFILRLNSLDPNPTIPIRSTITYIRDISCINYYICPRPRCFFGTNNISKLISHQGYCRDETKLSYKQEAYARPDDKLRRELVEEGILPSTDYQNMMFCVYDIESAMISGADVDVAKLISLHKLASIAIKSNFGDNSEHFFYRKNMDANGLMTIIKEFVTVLTDLQQQMVQMLPDSIQKGIKKYFDLMTSADYKGYSPDARNNVLSKVRILRGILSLKIYSWNGEKYDLNVLMSPLIDAFSQNEKLFKKMHVIKRGTGLMELRFGYLIFRDFLNYSSPMSLDDFAQSCGLTEISKTVFPYEKWANTDDIVKCTIFPPYIDFKTCMQKSWDSQFAREFYSIVNSKLSSDQFNNLR